MASFLESLTQVFTPDATQAVGKAAGLDAVTVMKGLAVAGPLLLGAMSRRASTPDGLSGLSRLLPQDGGAGLGNLAAMFSGAAARPEMLGGLFGSGLSATSRTLDRKLGFRASALLPLVVPVALSLLAKKKAAEKLDDQSIARALQDEHTAFLAKGGEQAVLARAALDAGMKGAELKARFTPEQWTRVRLAPGAAARLVMLASPSGALGLVKEANAAAMAIETAREASEPRSLLSLAFDSDITKDEVEVLGKDRGTTLNVLKEAVNLVSQKTPSELPAFAQFIHGVALKVAEETKEGGFLGIGGTRVSREEQAVLDEIDALTGAMA
jgi:hypothetical protein